MARLGPEVIVSRDHIVLKQHSLEKQGHPGKVRGFLSIEKFEDVKLCPVASILDYKARVS